MPKTQWGRTLLAFGLLNVLLLFLPVWDLAFNSGEMILGVLPLTVLWGFFACALNNLLAVVIYKKQFKPWAAAIEASDPSRTRG